MCGAKCICQLTVSFLLFSESAQVDKPAASLGTQSQSSSSGSGSLNAASGPPGSSTSTVPVSPVMQSPATPLLQDPTLLRQLLPALQTALQLNNASVDMAKINEGMNIFFLFFLELSFSLFPPISWVIFNWALIIYFFCCLWTCMVQLFQRNQILTGLIWAILQKCQHKMSLRNFCWVLKSNIRAKLALYSHK